MKYNRGDRQQIFTKGAVLGGHETIISTSKTYQMLKDQMTTQQYW